MFWPGFTQEQMEAWASHLQETNQSLNIPVKLPPKRCSSCGQFLPKNTEDMAYMTIGTDIIHVREFCISKSVNKEREKNPKWDWTCKEKNGGK
jgi:hypothetical protein